MYVYCIDDNNKSSIPKNPYKSHNVLFFGLSPFSFFATCMETVVLKNSPPPLPIMRPQKPPYLMNVIGSKQVHQTRTILAYQEPAVSAPTHHPLLLTSCRKTKRSKSLTRSKNNKQRLREVNMKSIWWLSVQ